VIQNVTKHALVDRDGTLIGTCIANKSAYDFALSTFGVKTKISLLSQIHEGKSWRIMGPELFPELNQRDLLKIHELKTRHFPEFFHLTTLNTELINILENIKRRAIVSNGTLLSTNQLVEFHKLQGFFEVSFGPDANTSPKPNPALYVNAMNYFGASPENTLVFEDSKDGMRAAQLAGLQVKVTKHLC
jgi:beta-phosphoglucomutase